MKNETKYEYLKRKEQEKNNAEFSAPCSTTYASILNKAFCPQLISKGEG